jgi:hypothetical protein
VCNKLQAATFCFPFVTFTPSTNRAPL